MGFPIHREFDATLNPGEWRGYSMGRTTLDEAYVAAYTLAKPPTNSGFLEKDVFQPEWDGKQWNTVLRLQMSKDVKPQPVKVRVYAISGMPVVREFDTTLQPGEWQGYGLGPATVDHGFLAGFAPSKPPIQGGFLEKSRFQAEWDGKQWNSVLRLQASSDLPSLGMLTHVYAVGK